MEITTFFLSIMLAIPTCYLLLIGMLQQRYRTLQSAALAVIVGFLLMFASLIVIYDLQMWALLIPILVIIEMLVFYFLSRTSP